MKYSVKIKKAYLAKTKIIAHADTFLGIVALAEEVLRSEKPNDVWVVNNEDGLVSWHNGRRID